MYLQTHEGHKDNVSSVPFLHYSMRYILDTTLCICPSRDCLPMDSSLRQVAASVDGTWIAYGLHNGNIEIRDEESHAVLKILEGRCGSVKKLAFSHDSLRLASASQDKTVKIWEISSGTCLRTLEIDSYGSVSSTAFSPDSVLLASAFENGAVKIWDVSRGACLHTLNGHHSFSHELAFSDDSTRLVSMSHDKIINIWDTNGGTRLQTLKTCVADDAADVFALRQYKETVTPQQTTHYSIVIFEDDTWITFHDEEWLWLPVEYRPGHLVISDGNIAVITCEGKRWTCQFV
jgi:WD40 repeat protein